MAQAVRRLEVDALETLGKDFLDFKAMTDLVEWLILLPPAKRRGAAAVALLEGALGDLAPQMKERVAELKKGYLKELSGVLLGFEGVADLEVWLSGQA